MSLFSKLTEYSKEDIVPMHMPGAKRKRDLLDFPNPYSVDITEISDFDNLHDASGIIKYEQDRLARIYSSKNAYILVNGSTCGNLAALYAAVSREDTILIEKNSHKSIYNAIELIGCKYKFIDDIAGTTPVGSYDVIDFEMLINNGIKTVVVTYPSYTGETYSIERLAKNVHDAGGILIVDSAHGAHLGFDDYFPRSAIACGADIAVISLHKTLPALTQTAALLVNSDRVNCKKIEHALEVFETSSPSYVLMASVSKCMDFMQENITDILKEYGKRLDTFYKQVGNLKVLSVRAPRIKEVVTFDPSKIIFSVGESALCGLDLFACLRDDYGIECEMYAGDYVLMMSTFMDTTEDLERVAKAIIDIDARTFEENITPCKHINEKYNKLLELKVGDTSSMTITVYPPSVPIVMAGDKITSEQTEQIKNAIDTGLNIIIQEI